jgi:hypothetical protein
MVMGGLVMNNLSMTAPKGMRDPCGGFLNVSFDVVVAMMEAGSGCWGMFAQKGTTGNGLDVMHFDIASARFDP